MITLVLLLCVAIASFSVTTLQFFSTHVWFPLAITLVPLEEREQMIASTKNRTLLQQPALWFCVFVASVTAIVLL